MNTEGFYGHCGRVIASRGVTASVCYAANGASEVGKLMRGEGMQNNGITGGRGGVIKPSHIGVAGAVTAGLAITGLLLIRKRAKRAEPRFSVVSRGERPAEEATGLADEPVRMEESVGSAAEYEAEKPKPDAIEAPEAESAEEARIESGAVQAEDTRAVPEASGKQRRGILAVRIVLLVIFISGLVYAGLSIARYFGASWVTESGIEKLRESLSGSQSGSFMWERSYEPEAEPGPDFAPESDTTPVPGFLAGATPEVPAVTAPGHEPERESSVPGERPYAISERLKPLYEQNSDLAGWITIDGTGIDYPVMHTPGDEQFYIDHSFSGDADVNGLPFLDARCEIAPKNQIQLIYGHNIKSGIMFHDLMRYESEEFWTEHKYISYETLYDNSVYEIVAAFVFDVSSAGTDGFQFHRFTEFPAQSVFDAYKKNILELSLYDTQADFGFEDQYLILATCEYSARDGRFVVMAKQIQ